MGRGRPKLGSEPGHFAAVTLPPELLRQIDDHARVTRRVNHRPNRSAAIRDLIRLGLDASANEFG